MDKSTIYEYTLEALKFSLFDKMQTIILRDKLTDEDIEGISLAIDAIDNCRKSIEWEKRWEADYAKKKGSQEN